MFSYRLSILQHQFVTRTRSPQVLIDLIQRTKAAVRELDNLNYRKMKKILMIDACETESTVGDADGMLSFLLKFDLRSQYLFISFFRLLYLYFYLYLIDTPDEQTGGDSSKSNSITSEHSIHSMGVSASSQSSSTNSLPLPNADANDYSTGSVRNRHKISAGGVTANLLEHGANNFATIRTTSIVTKQQKEHMQEEMHEQMSGYKRMRREHQGALVST